MAWRQDVVQQRLGAALLGVEPVEIEALALAQPTALEGGGDPGAQDRRVERLADEVLCPGGEALAGHLSMVDPGQDQGRQFGERRSGADREQQLEAVHAGHQEVEQDQVGRARGRGGRVPEVRRRPASTVVAGQGQDLHQQRPVVLVVVDHEDPAGAGGGLGQGTGGRGQGGGELGGAVGLGRAAGDEAVEPPQDGIDPLENALELGARQRRTVGDAAARRSP